ncbi:His/Gly/Thr/Pro-type tRNA ligase C-terminal domain-containing protein [Algiphilus sp.]|uniref:His/Gly/Thr/Pro-type tRNA ligase C-terminal domain-containing protein n=1 Tax=Algiphilus sp. TaxID=1872431 RepID=UPI003C679A47
MVNAGGGSFKAQFKRADRSGAGWAVVLGPEELAAGTLQIKSLRARDAQRTLPTDEAVAYLQQALRDGQPNA